MARYVVARYVVLVTDRIGHGSPGTWYWSRIALVTDRQVRGIAAAEQAGRSRGAGCSISSRLVASTRGRLQYQQQTGR